MSDELGWHLVASRCTADATSLGRSNVAGNGSARCCRCSYQHRRWRCDPHVDLRSALKAKARFYIEGATKAREGVEPVGLHDLRHSLDALAFASRELSLPEIADLARHATPNVTVTIYAGLSGDGRTKAASKLADVGIGR